MKRVKRLVALTLLVVFVSIPGRARADIAPPAQPPGSSLEPGTETTQVRMVAETVRLEVLPSAPADSLGQARVTASFTMRNTGDAAESMAVRFPLGADDGFFHIKEIAGFRAKVEGRQVPTHRILGEDPRRLSGAEQVPWASFDVTFPPGQDVSVEVSYTLEASGEYPFVYFSYILSTGAAWKDTIGSADISVTLPYPANEENVLFDSPGFTMWGTSADGVIDDRAINWHYEDLEPDEMDNFEINLVMPTAWQRYLAEEHNVGQNPNDGEAWGRLGKVCKEMAFSSRGKGFRAGGTLDLGGAKLYHRSLEAYDKAVTLLPNDALWHAGYADLLAYHAYFAGFSATDTTAEAVHALREIHTALTLSPNDPKIKAFAETISFFFPNGMVRSGDTYGFPWLTATPTHEVVTQVPSPTPLALPTFEVVEAIPSPTAAATATSQSAAASAVASPAASETGTGLSLPFCGSALLLPLGLLAVGVHRRSRGA